eukprot:CAMPEP_0171432970 /NCGR_PEP_ID=MMETSP0881-20121228/8228_1 /TAXON_ID=67004 /ORGANISM="Thalassiosira weissflogii, Strain CCMP1336" /LENGTH=339 /DNA_ID=CAMNT_0011953487 /DNA_START=149 /DNA_END=1168 /DNA_ORIENTATION=+
MRTTRIRQRQPNLLFGVILLITLIALVSNISPFASIICKAGATNENVLDDDDFLAEILAEEARQEEEHARLEAEAREFEAMKARQASSPGGGMPGGNPKMGGNKMRGGGGASRSMPKGASGATFSKLEQELKKKEAENAAKRAAEEEEQVSKEAERIRLKREAAFEAELKKMNEEQRRAAQKQKAKDAKVVQRILKASKAGKHYAVLGIRNLEVQLGPYYIFNISIGPIVLFRVKTKEIKRVYRNLARTVHPDKNKDGSAEEAFHALESSAAILTDEKKRSDYDKKIIASRRRRNKYAIESVLGASQKVWSHTLSTFRVTKRILGPFSTPILVIGALII